MLWHGWSDPALNPRATIRYVNEVRKQDPASEAYARLFLLPGVLHCSGGNGPDRVDWTAAIVDWVEKGTAPSRLLATKRGQDGNVVRSPSGVRLSAARGVFRLGQHRRAEQFRLPLMPVRQSVIRRCADA